MTKTHLLIALIISTLTKCGGDSTKNEISSATELEGVWSANCFTEKEDSKAGILDYSLSKYTFQNEKFTTYIETFEDKNCQSVGYVTETKGTFLMGLSKVDGSKEIDITNHEIKVTPKTQFSTNVLNKAELGGYSDWKINETKSLLGRRTSKTDETLIPTNEFSIFKMENSKLYFGENSITADKRPTTLNTKEQLSKSSADTSKLAVNKSSNSYIEDAEANDNLTLKETECDFANGQAKVRQFYTSELLGEGYIVTSDFTLPKVSEWQESKYTFKHTSSECGAPGYRAIQVSDVVSAKTEYVRKLKSLYGCGGSCTYELVSKTLEEDRYKTFEVKWTCTEILLNPLSNTGDFGSKIDSHTGYAICK